MKVIVVLSTLFALTLATSHQLRSLTQREILEYWTPERMQAAAPLDISPTNFNPSSVPVEISGTDAVYASVSRRAPFNFTSGYAPSYTTSPWKAIGRVFLTLGGADNYCSGSVVDSNLVLTAGHCVYFPGRGWSTNFVFVPGYNDGNRPFGSFAATSLTTSNAWLTSTAFCQDWAIATFEEDIESTTGRLGLLWNADLSHTWRSLGYPSQAPFNGSRMYYTEAVLGGTLDAGCGTNVIGVGSDTMGGASGGPWIINFDTNPQINSVNSFRQINPPSIYGPYFNTNFQNFFCNISSLC